MNLPMSLRITCEFCAAKLNVRADKLGQQFKCPSCRNVISAPPAAANDQNMDDTSGEVSAAESFDEGPDGFNFAEEFDLEGLLPESVPESDDLSRMPPARKPTSRGRKDKGRAATEAPASRAKPQNLCTVCNKQLSPGVRYCSGCGHNNFDADAAAVDAHLKIQTRMEQLTASLGVARLLKIFSRMFR